MRDNDACDFLFVLAVICTVIFAMLVLASFAPAPRINFPKYCQITHHAREEFAIVPCKDLDEWLQRQEDV